MRSFAHHFFWATLNPYYFVRPSIELRSVGSCAPLFDSTSTGTKKFTWHPAGENHCALKLHELTFDFQDVNIATCVIVFSVASYNDVVPQILLQHSTVFDHHWHIASKYFDWKKKSLCLWKNANGYEM